MIYLSVLVGRENDDGDFYQEYAVCFLDAADGITVYENIESVFGVAFSKEDINFLNKL